MDKQLQAFYDDLFDDAEFKKMLARESSRLAYVLIYGEYPTEDELEQYIGQLPEWLKGLAC